VLIAYELSYVSIVGVRLPTGEHALLALCPSEATALAIMEALSDEYPEVVEMPGELEAGTKLVRADPSRARSLEEMRLATEAPTRPR
jgi:hypothetical protein